MTYKWQIKAFYLNHIKQNWSWIWINMNVKHCVWSSNLFKNSFEKLKQCFQQKRLSLKCAKLLRKRSIWSFHKCSASLETPWNFLSISNNTTNRSLPSPVAKHFKARISPFSAKSDFDSPQPLISLQFQPVDLVLTPCSLLKPHRRSSQWAMTEVKHKWNFFIKCLK